MADLATTRMMENVVDKYVYSRDFYLQLIEIDKSSKNLKVKEFQEIVKSFESKDMK